jgi:ABC-2 type transport system permease protein/lipopolysaccharide transport system permease protein
MVPFATGVPLAFSALVVYFRDMSQVVPVILQLGLFATPVAYSFSLVPTRLQPVYALFNPLGPVIDGLRESILYGNAPPALPVAIAAVSSVLYLCGGYALFKRMEMGFADIA